MFWSDSGWRSITITEAAYHLPLIAELQV